MPKTNDTEDRSDGGAIQMGYEQMAEDEGREAEALEWAEATIGDIDDEREKKA